LKYLRKEEKAMKKAVLKLIANTGKKMAVKACGAASYFGYHQPVEPKKLSAVLKKSK
jgi:cyclic lactone autoinducer peptide